jgi:hypothetical protein
MKKKAVTKKSPTSKSDKKDYRNIYIDTDRLYQVTLKSIISSLVQHIPREILIEGSQYINTIYPKLKDLCLNNIMEGDTVKRRELAWKNVTNKILDVLHPLIQATNTEQKSLLQVPSDTNIKPDEPMKDVEPIVSVPESSSHTLNHAIKAYTQCRSTEKKNSFIHWPKPLEINFLQIKDADDVATISCKVGDVTIPYAMIDSGSDSSIVSENVAKHLGLKIDRKKIHRINGVASKSRSLGTVNDVPVTIDDGIDSLTTSDEFSVVPTETDNKGKELSLFILGTQWQYRAGWEPLVRGEFKVTRNGKTITIPLSVHKSQRNVFTVEKIPELIKKN